MPETLLTTMEAAAYLGLTASTLSKWRAAVYKGPVFEMRGRQVRYRRRVLDEWKAANPGPYRNSRKKGPR